MIKTTFCNLMEMWSMAPTFIIAYSKNEKMGLSYYDIYTGISLLNIYSLMKYCNI
jgi:hypothetical protein